MKTCPLCTAQIPAFLPLPQAYFRALTAAGCPYGADAFETLNARQYTCPACGGSDRDRLMGLYFQRQWIEDGRADGCRILEMAPSPPLTALLREFCGEYRSGDLAAGAAMDQVDITDMRPYADGRFDLLFCSHVLEHVRDDAAALRELNRVLAPGGEAVMLVPLPLDLRQTDEVAAAESLPPPGERLRRFGQDDHVRMYARQDFLSRIAGAGFEVAVLGPSEFPDDDFESFGLSPTSRLYVASKSHD